MLRYVLLIISVCLCSASNASLEHELEKFFDSYAEINNVSGPNAYKGESAGYYTGGSIYARTPPRIIHPVSMQLPNYSAGCGGIDLFTGGFSYINSDQLVNMMRNIGNNAQSLAFAIGLKTVMPMLANEVEQLNQWAQNINQFNINSCETAAMGLGMIWPQTEATQNVLCRANANQMVSHLPTLILGFIAVLKVILHLNQMLIIQSLTLIWHGKQLKIQRYSAMITNLLNL